MAEKAMKKGPKELQRGAPAPHFCLPDQNGEQVCLNDFQGRYVVLYFYPKDNTPGCTTEALEFTYYLAQFEENKAVILGVSPDSVKSHHNFCQKKDLGITLLSDSNREVLNKYGAWQLKKMYGRESRGVIRSTFLIDFQGIIQRIWSNVKVKGHVQEVLETLKGR